MKIDETGHISDMVVELLKQERIRRGISQHKLAKECGLCKTSIAFIERFENKPTLRTLLMISDCLQVDLGDVLKTVPQKQPAATPRHSTQNVLKPRLQTGLHSSEQTLKTEINKRIVG